MDPFLADIAELCRTQTTAAKWVIVPSYALGHTIGERLVIEGTNWANLRFTTSWDLALQMAAPFLIERDIDPAGDGLGPALMMRLLGELPPSTPTHFRALGEEPNIAEALWSAIRELRMAGLSATDLAATAFESADKRAELRALLSAYEAHLTAQRLADSASVYQDALQHLDVCPILASDLRFELPGVIRSPLEQKLLDALPGIRVDPRSLAVPGVSVPRRLTTHATPVAPAPASNAERLAFVLEPGAAPAPKRDDTLTMFRAGGREAEVEEVLRRVFASGAPLDRVEVACASADYPALVWEKAQRHHVPVTIGPGVPVTLTRPARALLAFCRWGQDGFPAGALRRLLQSGDVRLDLDDGPSAGQAARLLARSEATWGRQTYGTSLAALVTSARERSEDPECDDTARARYVERANQGERLRAWIASLLGLVPEPADGQVAIGEVIAGCKAFIADVAAKSSEMDGAAATVLSDALDELAGLSELRRPAAQALALIRHQIEGLSVGGDRARPGHLFVTMLRHAGFSGRPHTYVVGLEEGRALPSVLEDAVLLDAERQAISPLLATSRDHVSEALHAAVARLAVLGGRVCLSFSCHDVREHRETFPSWLLLQALRLLEPEREWTYRRLNEHLGAPVSAVPRDPGQALSEAGWWLAHLNGAGPSTLPNVYTAFPGLKGGEAAAAARESDAFTIYDGYVRSAGPVLDPRVSGRPVSATTLENLAKCPFRYFLERGLGLEAVEDVAPERDRWLDPMTRGALLHALYAEILREVRNANEALDPVRHGARLAALAEAKLVRHREQSPPPSESVYRRERQELLEDLALFVKLEAAARGREPIAFEVSFGGGPADGEPLAQADPLVLEPAPGLQFQLRGRIDRIDRLVDATYEVVDYKTGGYRPADFAGTFAGGRLLQPALYALAATALLRRRDPAARVSASGYYLPTARGGGERVVCRSIAADKTAGVLRDLFDVLAAGTFLHTPEKDDCKWCELGAACGPSAFEQASAKIDNTANRMLSAYRRLARHD